MEPGGGYDGRFFAPPSRLEMWSDQTLSGLVQLKHSEAFFVFFHPYRSLSLAYIYYSIGILTWDQTNVSSL